MGLSCVSRFVWAGFVTVLAIGGAAGLRAGGQGLPTATKESGVSVFGGYSRVATAFASSDNGFFVGGDVTRRTGFLYPSLEVRYTHSTGDVVGENSFTGGIKLEKPFGLFHPYVNFDVGYGVVNYTHPVIYPSGPYSTDNSFVFGAGGGLDYDLSPRFALKGDVQVQSWRLGNETSRLMPYIVSAGIVYRIPFRDLRGRR